MLNTVPDSLLDINNERFLVSDPFEASLQRILNLSCHISIFFAWRTGAES